ncbi:COG0637 Predicted phosphatase/phosphohexomutase [Microbacteriaceae bacterium]
MTIKAIVFDMDGTLVDAKEWHFHALNDALSIFGLEISAQDHESRFDGLPTRKKLEILSEEMGLPKSLHNIISSIKQDRTLRFVANECFPKMEQLLMFQWIRSKGLLLAVATNSIRRTAEQMLSSAGLLGQLDVLLTNEDVSLPKPDPEIYLRAAFELGVLPHECLVVEDNEYGITSATTAGCQVVRVSKVEQTRISLIETALSNEGLIK